MWVKRWVQEATGETGKTFMSRVKGIERFHCYEHISVR
jgi:hypothetical protein